MAARRRRGTALDFISAVKWPCFQRLTQEIIATGSRGSSRQLALQPRPGWRRARNISTDGIATTRRRKEASGPATASNLKRAISAAAVHAYDLALRFLL